MLNSKQYKIIQEYSSAVDRVNRSIGGKSVLYANNVLSKDPNAGGGFSKLLNGESIPSISYTRHVAHLGEYFFKSFVFISLWACKKALFNTVGQTSKKAQNLHIVDIFALSQNISKSEEFHDRYLQKLVETLYENGINYSYLLRFYQDGYNPVKWYKVYKTLRV